METQNATMETQNATTERSNANRVKNSVDNSNGNASQENPNGADSPNNLLRQLFQPVSDQLLAVDEMLAGEMRSDNDFVNELLTHSVRIGGKRLRPALLLLFAKALGKVNDDHITLATVIEMIHTATLVHDDVLDGADHRRHLPTHRTLWGNEASVLTGDFLFSRAFYLASGLETTHACREIGFSTNLVCEGEMRQIGTCNNVDLSEAEYLEIVEAKTAVLSATAAYLGAKYSDTSREGNLNDEDLARVRDYGRRLGIAFQIIDDVLDIAGAESRVGKSLGTDLQQLKPTLPLIHLLQDVETAKRDRLVKLLQNADQDSLGQLQSAMQASGSLEYATAKAESYANQAAELLVDLPDGDAKQTLLAIPRFVVRRRH